VLKVQINTEKTTEKANSALHFCNVLGCMKLKIKKYGKIKQFDGYEEQIFLPIKKFKILNVLESDKILNKII